MASASYDCVGLVGGWGAVDDGAGFGLVGKLDLGSFFNSVFVDVRHFCSGFAICFVCQRHDFTVGLGQRSFCSHEFCCVARRQDGVDSAVVGAGTQGFE